MRIDNMKLRRLTLGTQLLAGFGLLTASYLTTEHGWANEFVNAAILKEHSTSKIEVTTLGADLHC